MEAGEDFDGELAPVSIEDRAKAMGWKEPDTFRGDGRRFLSAEEFIQRGEEELPILRDNNKRMSEKLVRAEQALGSLRNTVAEQGQAVKDAMDLARRADERGYQRGIDELKAKQREAASVGDMEAFDQVEKQIKAAETERAIVPPGTVTVPIPQAAPGPDPETEDFVAANPWFNAKPILKRAMIDAHTAIVQAEGVAKGRALTDQYARAKAEVEADFPHHFAKPAPVVEDDDDEDERPRARPRLRLAGNLEPSGVVTPARRGGTAFDRIENPVERKDAKDAYERMTKMNTTDMSPEEYVSIYTGEQSDVLAMRAARKKA